MRDELTSAEIQSALLHKQITRIHVHEDDDGIGWIGLTLSDGSEIELSASGLHTQGWINVERGRRIRDIYGIQP